MRVIAAILVLLIVHALPPRGDAQPADRSGLNGEQLYRRACAACHGADGRGQPLPVRGFDIDPPDFTDCSLTTPEADLDWYAVIHQGGPARAFDRLMPAFGDELSAEEIGRLIAHVRGFCTEPGWPFGDLNMPRALVTEKAYPENEVVVTSTLSRGDGRRVTTEVLYEHRIGRRGQYELFARDIDEVGGAYKHVLFDSMRSASIISAGGEIKVGKQGAVLEAFGAVSQALPRIADGFMHAHAGIESPTETGAREEMFWRVAVGKSFMTNQWGRAWSPMIELLAAREIGSGAQVEWDALPQMQVSLSTRQHVLLNVGVRTPMTQRRERRTSVLVYLLWDWFDGGFLSGW
jgi:mono/diheme cytochrome c family protein